MLFVLKFFLVAYFVTVFAAQVACFVEGVVSVFVPLSAGVLNEWFLVLLFVSAVGVVKPLFLLLVQVSVVASVAFVQFFRALLVLIVSLTAVAVFVTRAVPQKWISRDTN